MSEDSAVLLVVGFLPWKMAVHLGQGLTQKGLTEQLPEDAWGQLIGRTNLNRAAKDDGAGC